VCDSDLSEVFFGVEVISPRVLAKEVLHGELDASIFNDFVGVDHFLREGAAEVTGAVVLILIACLLVSLSLVFAYFEMTLDNATLVGLPTLDDNRVKHELTRNLAH